jgi:hypothetical protein
VDIKWNDDGLNEMYNQVARGTAVRVQAALDKILETGRGKSTAEVKVLLQQEIRSALGVTSQILN